MSRFTNAISADELFETPVNPVMPCATRVNTRESNPGVMRPLDLTVVAIPMDHGIRRSLRDLGIHDNDPPGFIGRIHHGRWYVNLSWVMWQADILPFTRAADWEAQLFGSTGSFVIERPRLTGSQRLRRNVFLPRFLFRMVQAVAGAGGGCSEAWTPAGTSTRAACHLPNCERCWKPFRTRSRRLRSG